jgi:hypothetical protein
LDQYQNGANFVHSTQATGIVSLNVANATPNKIDITYGRSLNTAAPAISVYTVAGKTVSSISITGAVVSITLTTYYAYGDTPTISYTKPVSNPIQDTNGVICNSFPAIPVVCDIANPWNAIVFASLYQCTQLNGTLTATGSICAALATKYLPAGVSGAIRQTITNVDHSIGFSIGLGTANGAPTGVYTDCGYGMMYHTNKKLYYIPVFDTTVTVVANSVIEIKKYGTTLELNYSSDGINFVNKKTVTISDVNLYIRVGSNNGAMVTGDTLSNCVLTSGFVTI